MGSRAVELDRAAAGLTLDGVGFQAVAVVDIHHLHALERQDIGGVHEAAVYGNRADVVEVRSSDGGTVNLAVKHRTQHNR